MVSFVIGKISIKLVIIPHLCPQHSLLCCLASTGRSPGVEEAGRREVEVDRVEAAFRRWDTDQDGFLSWPEFKQVHTHTHSSVYSLDTLD